MACLENYDVVVVATAVIYKAEEMAQWIREKCKNFALVAIKTHYAKDINSCCEFYENGSLRQKFRLISYHHSLSFIDPAFFVWLSWSAHFFSVCYAFLRLGKRFDIYLGVGYFDALIGLLLRRLGVCNLVIYYAGDYFRECEKWDWKNWYRSLQTKIFQFIDRINVRFSDAIWNTSSSMVLVRKEKNIFVSKKAPQLVVPIGFVVHEKVFNSKWRDFNDFVFIGNLQQHQGLDLILDCFQELISDIPDIKLHIIGKGSYEFVLKDMVSSKKLDQYIKFYGFIESERTLAEIFSRCTVGVATYILKKESFIQYVDPGKVKVYLSYGLPVIMTPASKIAKRIDKAEAGIIINYTKQELKQAIIKLLKDKDLSNKYRQNARSLAREFNWDKVFSNAFRQTLNGWRTKEL